MGKLEQHPASAPPAPAVMSILSRYDREQLRAFVEIAIDLADTMDADADEEEDDPPEADGDEADQAWIEWSTMRGSQKRGPNFTAGHEDDEEDDPAGQCDEDGINTDLWAAYGKGAGCVISDPGGCEQDGREPDDDAEREQMTNDVPVLPVFTAGHNIFNDQRQLLGFSNLQTSFRTGGKTIRSADTGEELCTRGWPEKPGTPV